MEGDREGVVRHRFPVLAEDFHPIPFAAPPEEGVLDQGGPFDAVNFPAPGGTQLAFLAASHGIDSSLHGGRDPAQTFGNPEGVGQHPSCRESGERHLRAGAHAIEGGGGQRQSGLGKQFRSGRLIADAQGRAHRERRFVSGDTLLGIEVELSLQLIGLGMVFEFGQGRQPPIGIGQDDGASARGGCERNLDATVLGIGFPLATVEPGDGVGDDAGILVEDLDQIAARPVGLQQRKPSASEEGPGGTSAADNLDDPSSPLPLEFGKAKRPCVPEEGRRLPVVTLLGVGHPTIEREVGVQGALVRLKVAKGVDLEETDHDLRRVLESHAHRDFLVQRNARCIGGRKFDVHPILQRLICRRRQQGGPALGFPGTLGDLGFGEEGFDPGVPEPFGPRFPLGISGSEMQEEFTD